MKHLRNYGSTRILFIFSAFLFTHFCLHCQLGSVEEKGWDRLPEILSRIIAPTFPEHDFIITDYGAVGDGTTDCTEALKKTIELCHKTGGGRVVVPQGVFLTGAIHLKTGVNLHVSQDATLLFSRDTEEYLPLVYTRYEGVELMNYSPFIYAYEQENMAITGGGVLDGNADQSVWWSWKRSSGQSLTEDIPLERQDRDRLFKMAEEGVPVEDRVFGQGHYLRVNFIQFYKCKNLLIEGITIKRSPMWEIHPVLCENVTVHKIRVISHGPNNDGCNPESSKNVLIKECYFDTGDDCIAIKSGRNADGRRINVPSENIVVQKCTMKDGHGGVVIGSEMTGGCRNVFIEDCMMDSPNLERALRIKTNTLRGGTVENIYMRDVTVGEVRDAVVRVYFHYAGETGDFMPTVRNIYLNRVTSQKSRYAMLLDGLEESPISNVHLRLCDFNGVQNGNILRHVKGFIPIDVRMNGENLE